MENVNLEKSAGAEHCRAARTIARYLFIAVCSIVLGACSAWAQSETTSSRELKYVVILTRHGVRSPTSKLQDLHSYSAKPWPSWGVEPGMLTAHGARLMTLMGVYDRAYLTSQRLLESSGCADAGRVHIRADVDQRTRETGRVWAEGLLPGCKVNIEVIESADPLFGPITTGVAKPDRALALASITGRIGGNASALAATHQQAFERLRYLLFDCKPKLPCPAESQPGKRALLNSLRRLSPAKVSGCQT